MLFAPADASAMLTTMTMNHLFFYVSTRIILRMGEAHLLVYADATLSFYLTFSS